jgi:ppGpp synthetase/RelA/SpoT-type nucleotidyltranferase
MTNYFLFNFEQERPAEIGRIWRWREDCQSESLNTGHEYKERAEYLEPFILEFIDDVLQSVQDQLLGKIEISFRIKSLDSIAEKLHEKNVNGDPSQIGDYFGIKIIAENVEDVNLLIDAFYKTPNTTSYKNNFLAPEEGGYMAWKSHHKIADRNGENDLSFEIQICLQSMEILNDLTHQILKKERSLKKENRDDRERIGNLESRLIDEKSSTKLYNAFNRENENVTRRINGREINIKELEKLREFIHFVSGEISGANTMMDSNIYAEKASEITKIGFTNMAFRVLSTVTPEDMRVFQDIVKQAELSLKEKGYPKSEIVEVLRVLFKGFRSVAGFKDTPPQP